VAATLPRRSVSCRTGSLPLSWTAASSPPMPAMLWVQVEPRCVQAGESDGSE
jgi:hypothetical protein